MEGTQILCGLGTQEVLGGSGWTEEGQGLHLELLMAPLPSVKVDWGLPGPTAPYWASLRHRNKEQTWRGLAQVD